MAGLGRGEQRLAVARIEHEVAHVVPEEMGAVRPPCPSRRVAVEQPRALAGRHQQQRLFRLFRFSLGHRRSSYEIFSCLRSAAAATVSRIGRTGRTSILPTRAGGIFEAIWMASFKSRASIM